MSDLSQEMKIVIETIAKTRGLEVTDEGLKRVKASIEATAAEGKKLTASVDDIAKALQGAGDAAGAGSKGTDIFSRALVRIEEQEKNVTQAQRDARSELAQRTAWELKYYEVTSKGSESAARNLGALRIGFSGLKDVANGALNGNVFQIGQGLSRISKGAEEASGALKGFFSQVIRGGAAGAAIGAPIAVGLLVLKKQAADIQKEMDAIWVQAAKSHEAYAASVEANTARIQKALETELKEIQKLVDAYAKRQAQIDAANQRADKLREPERALRDANLNNSEQDSLRKAQSDEERTRISADFARRREGAKVRDTLGDLSNSDFAAKTTIGAGQDAINAAQAENRNIESKLSDAQAEVTAATEAAKPFKRKLGANGFEDIIDTTDQAQAARRRGMLAQDNLTKVKAEADQEFAKNSELIKGAQGSIDSAKLQIEETALRRAAYKATIDGQIKEKSAKAQTDPEAQKDAANLKAALKTDEHKAADKPAGPIVGEINGVAVNRNAGPGKGIYATKSSESDPVFHSATSGLAAISDAADAFHSVTSGVAAFAKGVTDDSKKLASTLQNERERSGGG